MIYGEERMEMKAVLDTAAKMCAAARTAPKAQGKDFIVTLVLTGAEKDALADKMEEVWHREFDQPEGHYIKDAKYVRRSDAVVMIGVEKTFQGMPYCKFCGFENCTTAAKAGGRCQFNGINLGIALGSAAATAADNRVDSRIINSAGKVAEEMDYVEGKDIMWEAIPIKVSGKSIWFDRDKDRPVRPRRELNPKYKKIEEQDK